MKTDIRSMSKIVYRDHYQAKGELRKIYEGVKDLKIEYIDPAVEGYRNLDFDNKYYFRVSK